MEPCYNEVPWYQNKLLLVTRCIVGTSLQRSIAGQGVIWGGERVEPGEMRWCRQSTLVHLLKSFLEWYERDIERARYCPQDRESVQHEDIWHQNGITEWQHQRHVSRLCYIPSPPLQATAFSFLTLFFALFPDCGAGSRLSKFGQSEIEKIFWMKDNVLYSCIWIMNDNIKSI